MTAHQRQYEEYAKIFKDKPDPRASFTEQMHVEMQKMKMVEEQAKDISGYKFYQISFQQLLAMIAASHDI